MTVSHDMACIHETFLARLFGGRRSKGSGNLPNDQADGRNRRFETSHPLSWEAKATAKKSYAVSVATWDKLVEQAGAEIPVLALRFVDQPREGNRISDIDLVCLDAHDFVEILEAARSAT
jgi:hypothetical protein